MAIVEDFTWRELGERIRRRRISRGISQQGLAIAAGLTQNAIFRLEGGETNPQIATLQQVAKGLGCSVRYLLCGMAESSSQIAGRLSRVRTVIESGDETAIGILDNGIGAAEALLARSDRRRSMPPEPVKRVAKGEGRRGPTLDSLIKTPSQGKSEPHGSDLAISVKLPGGRIRKRASEHEHEIR